MLIRNCGFCTINLPFFFKLIDCFVNTLTSLFTAIFSISDRFLAIPAPLTIEASFLVIGRVLGLRLICCCKGTKKIALLQIFSPKKHAKKHALILTRYFLVKLMLFDDSNDDYSFEIALVHQSRTYLFILL